MNNDFEMPKAYNKSFLLSAGATWMEIEYWSTVTNTSRKANVILPKDYDDSKKYPVLYLLHGIGGDENEWKNAGSEYILGNLSAELQAPQMITVLPNVRARSNDGNNPEDIFTIEHFQAFDRFKEDLQKCLMPYIKEHFSILEGRENTAIAGLSMGGRETLYIGLTMPEVFGSVGAFSPAFGVFPYTNNSVTEPGLFKKEDFRVREAYKDSTFLMIMTGDNDTVVWDEPMRYHEVLQDNGTEHLFYITRGGHDFDVWSNGLYNFIKRRTLWLQQ